MTLPEFLTALGTLGGASGPIFAVLYWLERGERKELQEKNEALGERALVALTETKATLQTFMSIVSAPGTK